MCIRDRCPWDAGGTSDGLCRIVSEIGARDEYFGVNMVVQNSGGAGGTVATCLLYTSITCRG